MFLLMLGIRARDVPVFLLRLDGGQALLPVLCSTSRRGGQARVPVLHRESCIRFASEGASERDWRGYLCHTAASAASAARREDLVSHPRDASAACAAAGSKRLGIRDDRV